MSFFIKTNISSKIIWIIDIWSYKIRVSICKFKNRKATLIWYWEKRQDTSCLLNGDCENIELLSENIKIALNKAEKNANKIIKNIIINFPFSDIFFSLKKINYKRKDWEKPISKEELEKILSKSEDLILKRSINNIKLKSWYIENELKLIIWNIVKLYIDKKSNKRILKKIWNNINISLINIFIPTNKYNIINHIWNIIKKKIIKIIPSEYSIAKIFPEKNLIIINIWATNTYISIKKEDTVIWISKIWIWINDLINQILKNTKDTKINIINKLNSELYKKEKDSFLSIWWDALIIWIKEIVKNNICPSKITILGWWKNNFIKNYIDNLNLSKENIRIIKKIRLIEFENKKLKDEITDYEIIRKKITLDSLSLIIEINNFLKKENDIISEILKKVVRKLWFHNY